MNQPSTRTSIPRSNSGSTRRARVAHSCAFCGGKGVDPYASLSDRSTCGACNGKGTMMVPSPFVRCAYCQGSGSYKMYRCLICGGSGVVAAPTGPTQRCPSCNGRAFEASSGLACLTCKGRGVIPARPQTSKSPEKAPR